MAIGAGGGPGMMKRRGNGSSGISWSKETVERSAANSWRQSAHWARHWSILAESTSEI